MKCLDCGQRTTSAAPDHAVAAGLRVRSEGRRRRRARVAFDM